MDRRTFVHAAMASLGGCALRMNLPTLRLSDAAPPMHPSEALPGHVSSDESLHAIHLEAAPAHFEIPGLGVFEKWLYNGAYPGPEIRVREGEKIRITVANRLPEGTTVHWHGIPLRNPMDGVPNITQPAIKTSESFDYEFEASPAGTFMYHSHFGLQSDRGLAGPLIVEEKAPHVSYDREYTLVLTDFLSGPPALMKSGSSGRSSAAMETPPYIAALINGRPAEAPAVFTVKSGERARLRLVNPSGATIYRFAIGGHPLIVSHADSRPVEPLKVDALHIAPGERYDVLVEAMSPGAWPIIAQPDNDLPAARAILRYSDSNETVPRTALQEAMPRGRMLQVADLRGLETVPVVKPGKTFTLVLGSRAGKPGEMGDPVWTMNDQAYPKADPLEVRAGESVRIRLVNQSAMPHPIHLHGHFFRVNNALKDTTIVWTNQGKVELDFAAKNPGAWLFHCHNVYHMESGMMRVIRYV